MASFTDQLAKFFGMSETDTSLRELFVSELKGIYYAEKQFADAQPNMADAATTDVVRNAFEQHNAETKNQIDRLEQVFHILGVDVDEKTCNAADGLVDDGDVVIAETDSGSLTRDAALIIAGQKVEHHEIAAYGSLQSLARLLGYHEVAQLLEQTLQEEKNTDKKLTEIAESFINERAKLESDTNGNNDLNSNVRDTVRDGDYGNTAGAAIPGSTYAGVTGTGTEYGSDYVGTESSRETSGNTNYAGTYGNRTDDATDLNKVGSTGNVGYGTGASSNPSSDDVSYNDYGNSSTDERYRSGDANATSGSTSGV